MCNRKGRRLTEESQSTGNGRGTTATGVESLSVTDNRTGASYEVEIKDGTVRAMDFRQIKVDEEDFGLMTYDPGYSNTASCRSDITHHTYVHENIKKFMNGFRHDANPMGMLQASVGALSTFYPEAKDIDDEYQRHVAAVRLIAKMPTLAAFSYRHSLGLPYVYPDNDLSYAGNFLSMLFKMAEPKYEPDPRLEKALDVLFILHADHEQNCSAAAVRVVGSSRVDPFSAIAAGCAGLYGPLHGGANVAVLRMLQRIGSTDNIVDFLEGVKQGEERLMGFGHRVYKNYDPRARIIRGHVDEVLEATNKESPLLDIAIELEKHALDDDYFTSRKLYPNVDFYSGLIYEALGIPTDAFTVMFAIPRTSGWMAQWMEMMEDPELKIARPRQIYTGPRDTDYIPMDER